MDIGGSLTKIAYYSSLPTKKINYGGGGASVHYEVGGTSLLEQLDNVEIDSTICRFP